MFVYLYMCVFVCIPVWEEILYIGSVDVLYVHWDLHDAALVFGNGLIWQAIHVKSG